MRLSSNPTVSALSTDAESLGDVRHGAAGEDALSEKVTAVNVG